jgi:ubiquinone/menaquinone biosynthesis C-methylase UbiE
MNILREPRTLERIEYVQEGSDEYFNAPGKRYKVDDGIIRFIEFDELKGNNRVFQSMYDKMAPLYDVSTKFHALIKSGGEKKRVAEYLSALDIGDGDKVLEISVGTGRNIVHLNPAAEYFGVDISMGMMFKCQSTMLKAKREIKLLQAEAEALPFCDNAFDVVFSAGGFNFYNDRKRAVEEMLRVAKPGTRLMIYDETQKVKEKYEKAPVAGNFYSRGNITDPKAFIPEDCIDMQYREVCGGELYVLTFRKP